MRRFAWGFVIGAVAGVATVAGFTLAGFTPPPWVTALVVLVALAEIGAVFFLSTDPQTTSAALMDRRTPRA